MLLWVEFSFLPYHLSIYRLFFILIFLKCYFSCSGYSTIVWASFTKSTANGRYDQDASTTDGTSFDRTFTPVCSCTNNQCCFSTNTKILATKAATFDCGCSSFPITWCWKLTSLWLFYKFILRHANSLNRIFPKRVNSYVEI